MASRVKKGERLLGQQKALALHEFGKEVTC